MKKSLRADLAKLESLAFARVAACRELAERFHRLPTAARKHSEYALLEKLFAWAFVPFSIWPVDVRGLGLLVVECIEAGRELDEGARMLSVLLPAAPSAEVREAVAEHEHEVKAGSYETLIEAQDKFNALEQQLAENPELKSDWERIKGKFPVASYQNAKGIIRRRMVQERNFRPKDWKFAWQTEAQRFQNVFDAYCHRWDLYGMEGDRPLLLKLTVNVTAYGTIIMIPRYWSFDPRRDLKWKAITRLHRVRSAQKQGAKMSANEAQRRDEAERARELWTEATTAGLKGEERNEWVMVRLGWDPRTDGRKLRAIRKRKQAVFSKWQ